MGGRQGPFAPPHALPPFALPPPPAHRPTAGAWPAPAAFSGRRTRRYVGERYVDKAWWRIGKAVCNLLPHIAYASRYKPGVPGKACVANITCPPIIPKISWQTAGALVISNMVGTGVFTSLGFQLSAVQNTWSIILLWVLGGILALIGAFTFAELGTHYPNENGGDYIFISKGLHPFLGLPVGLGVAGGRIFGTGSHCGQGHGSLPVTVWADQPTGTSRWPLSWPSGCCIRLA